MDSWKTEITVEMLPEQYRELADEIGVENLLKLSHLIGGCNTYIPKEERLTRMVRDEMIKEDRNKYSCKQLAIKYKLSESRIRAIVSKEKIMKGQVSLFDE